MNALLNRMKVAFISLLLSLWYEDQHIRENEKLYLYSLYSVGTLSNGEAQPRAAKEVRGLWCWILDVLCGSSLKEES
jgi:hypothetical protein